MSLPGRPAASRTAVVTAAALAAVAAIVTLAVLHQVHEGVSSPWDLNGERNWPALYSSALLAGAASLAGLIAFLRRRERDWGWWAAMGAFFALMALDEWSVLHESLEEWSGVDWQLLYLLPAALGGLAWIQVLRRMWRATAAAAAYLAGAVAWIVAQALENLQWRGDVLVHPGLVLPEETLEVIGSTLFGLGLLLVLLDLIERRPR